MPTIETPSLTAMIITAPVTDGPTLQPPHGAQPFLTDTITVEYRRWPDGPWRTFQITLSGRRVLKSGRLHEFHRSEWRWTLTTLKGEPQAQYLSKVDHLEEMPSWAARWATDHRPGEGF